MRSDVSSSWGWLAVHDLHTLGVNYCTMRLEASAGAEAAAAAETEPLLLSLLTQ